MNSLRGIPGLTLLACILLMPACNRNKQPADLPDIQSVYSNIDYLDSLVRSALIDSIAKVNDRISDTLNAHNRLAQSPDDPAILDSLARIHAVTQDLLEFCISAQANLDMLRQDTKALENRYRSGKTDLGTYTSVLVENDQTLVDIQIQLSDKTQKALEYLKNQSFLISLLSPVPMTVER